MSLSAPEIIDLSAVTLLCFENADHAKALHLMGDMCKIARFGDVIWLNRHRTLKEFQQEEFRTSHLVRTSHILTTHLDGFVINPDLWNPDWLQYDYIGAPWPEGYLQQFNKSWVHRVGNSGFRLTSKKLLDRAKALEQRYAVFDICLCQMARQQLESEGFRFAPVDVAAQFSVELQCDETPDRTFGFHGKWPTSDNPPLYYKPGTSAQTVISKPRKRLVLLSTGGGENERTDFAYKTWKNAEVHILRNLPRNASDIGEERGCYYIKDVLDFSRILTGEVFAYVNNDCALVSGWQVPMLDAVEKYGCAYSQRIDMPKFRPMTGDEAKQYKPYCGADVFMWTPEWWNARRDKFPDLVLGLEGWDWVLASMMKDSGFKGIPPVAYHQAHQPVWAEPSVLTVHPAQIEVRRRMAAWAREAGLQDCVGGPNGFFWNDKLLK